MCYHVDLIFSCACDRISCSPELPGAQSTVEGDLELLMLMPPECRDNNSTGLNL